MPPNKDRNSLSPTWATSFLDLAAETKTTGVDEEPAPFCWGAWQDLTNSATPPWSPLATPQTCPDVQPATIKACQSFARAYWAAGTTSATFWRNSAKNEFRIGRTAITSYLNKMTARWELNKRIDKEVHNAGLSIFHKADPTLTEYINVDQCTAPLAVLLDDWFGEEVTDTFALNQAAWAFLKSLLAMSFNRFRKALGRHRERIEAAKAAYELARDAACKEGSTEKDARAHIKTLNAYLLAVTPWQSHVSNKDVHAELVSQLEGMDAVLRDEVNDTKALKLPKALRLALQNLPSPRVREDVMAQVMEGLKVGQEDTVDVELGDIEFSEWKEGIEAYSHLTVQDMAALFGLPEEKIPFFNDKIDLEGNDEPWSVGGREALTSPAAVPLRPFWHQWIGITKIVDNLMADRNVLLMDSVGVGKTLQAVGAIAVYEWLKLRAASEHGLPKHFRTSKMASVPLPTQPHVILCPPNLVAQWTTEVQRYIQFGGVILLPYLGACTLDNRKPFWTEYEKHKGKVPIVIIATYQALRSDTEVFYRVPDKAPKTFDEPLKERRNNDGVLTGLTLFGGKRRYGMVICDEVHNARTTGTNQVGVAMLARRARQVIGMTATPIVTSPLDVVQLARILQIPGFSVDAMEEYRLEYRRAKAKEAKRRKEQTHLAMAIQQGLRLRDAEALPSKVALFQWLDTVRTTLAEYVIRRTTHSLDREGKPIHQLEPMTRIRFVVTLRDEEMEAQAELAQKLIEGDTVNSFYRVSRKGLLHMNLADFGRWVFPEDKDSFTYKSCPSTKIDALIELLLYHKDKCCARPAKIEKGHVVGSQEGMPWTIVPDASIDKIIVYLAFPSSNWIVRKALEEAGLEFEEIRGDITAPNRAKILDRFRRGNKQILLMSQVGSVGLNIAFANIVILVDNLWSAQETEQLMGRVWRPPQKKCCIAYDIIAAGTSDVFLEALSTEKGLMHAKLMNMETELRRAVESGEGKEFASDMEEDPEPAPKKKRSSGKPTVSARKTSTAKKAPAARKKGKAAPKSTPDVLDEDDKDDDEHSSGPAPSVPEPQGNEEAEANDGQQPVLDDRPGDEPSTGPAPSAPGPKGNEEAEANDGQQPMLEDRPGDEPSTGPAPSAPGPKGNEEAEANDGQQPMLDDRPDDEPSSGPAPSAPGPEGNEEAEASNGQQPMLDDRPDGGATLPDYDEPRAYIEIDTPSTAQSNSTGDGKGKMPAAADAEEDIDMPSPLEGEDVDMAEVSDAPSTARKNRVQGASLSKPPAKKARVVKASAASLGLDGVRQLDLGNLPPAGGSSRGGGRGGRGGRGARARK